MKIKLCLNHVVRMVLLAGIFLVGSIGTLAQDGPPAILEETLWDFEAYELGNAPVEWQSGDAQSSSTSNIWQVMRETDNAGLNQVMAMSRPNSGGLFGLFGRTFNLIWLKSPSFQNGEIEVQFRSLSGDKNRGGGIVWRLQDKDNYYLAQFDPLENSFRIYFVRNGSRQELERISVLLSDHDWHSMKIVLRGNEFEGYLNGQKLLSGSSNLFRQAGAVGLWTKGDAVTWFDNLVIRPQEQVMF